MSGPILLASFNELPQWSTRLLTLAERDPRRAVPLARRVYARASTQSPFDQAVLSYILGYTLLRWERLDDAETFLVEAHQRMQALHLDLFALHVQRALLYLAQLRGNTANLADAWRAVAEAYEHHDDVLSAARARLGEMIQLNLQRRADAALELASAIRPVFEKQGTAADMAWLYRLIGVAHANMGASEEALSYLDQAATLFAQLDYRVEMAKTWFECASVHDLRENPAPALAELERAYRLFRRLDLPLRIAFCEKDIGWIYTLRGHYDQGIRFSLQAYDRFITLGHRSAAAGCELNLGNVAYYAGLWDLALASYQRAERVYVDLQFEHLQLICRRNQALVLRAQGQPEAALQCLNDLLPIVTQRSMPYEQAEVIHARGQALAALERVDEAQQDFARAEQLFRTLKNDAAAGESKLECGWLLLQGGQIEQAAQELQVAATLLSERPIHQWRAVYGLGICAERQGHAHADAALTLYRDACLTVTHLRQRLANEHASSGLFAQAQRLLLDALKLAWLQRNAVVVLELAEFQRALVLARTVREAHALAASKELGGVADLRSSWQEASGSGFEQALQDYREERLRNRRLQPIADDDLLTEFDLATVRETCQAAFPTGWTILAYVPCDDLLLTVAVDHETITITSVPFDTRLRRRLAQATSPSHRILTYQLGGGAWQPQVNSDWSTLSELGATLIPSEIVDRLHPDHRLLIVAGGVLQQVPWSALRVRGSWLVEQATPQMIPGLLIWPELVKRQIQGNDALLIGIQDFGDRALELPNALATLDLVEHKWVGHVTRVEGARVDMLRDWAAHGQLRRYSHILASTHGQLVTSSGLLAHLKLADGDLFYDDIVTLGLSGAVVVLAACEGAASEILPGEEVLSLSRAFLAAGARDVIASQWQVYDNAILEFLDLLYDDLATGLDSPTALAHAQRRWLGQRKDDAELQALVQAPLVWASLCVLGAGTVPIA